MNSRRLMCPAATAWRGLSGWFAAQYHGADGRSLHLKCSESRRERPSRRVAVMRGAGTGRGAYGIIGPICQLELAARQAVPAIYPE